MECLISDKVLVLGRLSVCTVRNDDLTSSNSKGYGECGGCAVVDAE